MNKTWKRFWLGVGLVAVLFAGTIFFYLERTASEDGLVGQRDSHPEQVEVEGTSKDEKVESEDGKEGFVSRVVEKVSRKKKEIQDEYFAQSDVEYNVPFTAQAPEGNWEPPYDEACEEASMLMVSAYLNDEGLDAEKANRSILDQVAWQEEQGYTIDLTAAETKEVLASYFDISSELVYKPTITEIQKALDNEQLVIVPAAGRLLENPYFTPPGPLYHMLVVTGYDNEQEEFITNDPGTRRGDGYRYDYDVLMNALHDWNDGDVYNGQKVMIVVPSE